MISLDHSFDADGLHGMRAAVALHGGRLGTSGEGLEHLLIVASELANNAVRHGGGSGLLRLWRTGDCLYCQVSDEGPGIVGGSLGIVPPDPGQIGGRGLWITRQLTDHLDIVSGPTGAVVTAVMMVQAADDAADTIDAQRSGSANRPARDTPDGPAGPPAGGAP